jgi:hypothetical protein
MVISAYHIVGALGTLLIGLYYYSKQSDSEGGFKAVNMIDLFLLIMTGLWLAYDFFRC